MKKLTHGDILQQRLTVEDALKTERHPVSLIVDNVRSLYNVGSIFRTADAAFLKELVLCGYTPHPPRIEIEKTALGAVDTVPWKYNSNTLDAVESFKNAGVKVLAVELTNSGKSYDELTRGDFPLALVIGNEITGINDEVLTACDGAIEIPMYGVKHSLNVSVATGIVLFEAVRKWRLVAGK
ncbi:MAG TPA: RNA methyltransferase [Patescibacteria group bacterium]|nr:RNA methyltransferase [Patescibacteria group bacterium]